MPSIQKGTKRPLECIFERKKWMNPSLLAPHHHCVLKNSTGQGTQCLLQLFRCIEQDILSQEGTAHILNTLELYIYHKVLTDGKSILRKVWFFFPPAYGLVEIIWIPHCEFKIPRFNPPSQNRHKVQFYTWLCRALWNLAPTYHFMCFTSLFLEASLSLWGPPSTPCFSTSTFLLTHL